MFLEKLRMDGRVALVTGGGRGIGLACVQALAEAGATTIVADFDRDVARAGQDEMRKAGHEVHVVELDVTDSAAVKRVADEVVARHGRIDAVVNNAGIARSGKGGEETPDELWLHVNDVNLNGVFWCCREFGGHMLKAGRGSIVNIGSMSGFIVNRPQKQAYYNASKAAVHHLTKSLAAEWAALGVRVHAVAPTYIETPLLQTLEDADRLVPGWLADTPMGRLGQPHEIASVVHFLASDASSLMTGSIVLADGGFTCW
jgi:NAD(P)-dependent dehydrogenase (short-subunit alcohol dehydrogenase family)